LQNFFTDDLNAVIGINRFWIPSYIDFSIIRKRNNPSLERGTCEEGGCGVESDCCCLILTFDKLFKIFETWYFW
jgi:hypothetical protein